MDRAKMGGAGADDYSLNDTTVLFQTRLAGVLIGLLVVLEFPFLAARHSVIIHARAFVSDGFLEDFPGPLIYLFDVALFQVLDAR